MINVVTFPGLGLEFTLDRVAFHLFGRPIFWYGHHHRLRDAAGSLPLLPVGAAVRHRTRPHPGPDVFRCPGGPGRGPGLLCDLQPGPVPARRRLAGLGAILRYSDGGLAIYGAIISSVIVLLIFCKVQKVSFLAFADLGVHGLFIGQLIGRWGNFMNVEAFGSTTTLPWRMCGTSIAEYLLQSGYVDQAGYEAVLSGALGVHPTFFYESMWNLAGLFLVYQIGKRWRKYDGECFLFYLCWYGLGRAWIEGLRTDSLYFFGLELFGMPIRVSQMVAVVCFLAAGALLLYQRSRPHAPAQLYVNQLRRQKDDQKTETEEE